MVSTSCLMLWTSLAYLKVSSFEHFFTHNAYTSHTLFPSSSTRSFQCHSKQRTRSHSQAFDIPIKVVISLANLNLLLSRSYSLKSLQYLFQDFKHSMSHIHHWWFFLFCLSMSVGSSSLLQQSQSSYEQLFFSLLFVSTSRLHNNSTLSFSHREWEFIRLNPKRSLTHFR